MFKKKSTKEMVKSKGHDLSVEDSAVSPEEQKPPKKAKAQKSPKNPASKASIKDLLKNKAIIGILCLICAALFAFVVVPFIQAQLAKTIPVVIFTQDVPVAAQITADMLEYREMGTVGLPAGCVYNTEDAVGCYVTIAGAAGDVLTVGRLSQQLPTDDPALNNLPPEKLAMSISLIDLAQSVSGKLRAGDVIQLFAIETNNAEAGNYMAITIPELQRVEVLAVTNADAQDIEATGVARTDETPSQRQINAVTLAVNARQAAVLAGYEHLATLHAGLVTRGDETAKADALKQQADYFLSDLPLPSPDPEVTPEPENAADGEADAE